VDKFELATRAVIRVGIGRGFIISSKQGHLVVTAAHCLRRMPRPALSLSSDERTYRSLLAPLDEKRRTVSAECLFVDPISDVAVLGAPRREKAAAYSKLTRGMRPLRVAATRRRTAAWFLSLDCRWVRCTLSRSRRGYRISAARQAIEHGTSGSPILNSSGAVLGILCAAPGEINPRLDIHLPRWVIQ
jgi:S1-C subfamily serine protease